MKHVIIAHAIAWVAKKCGGIFREESRVDKYTVVPTLIITGFLIFFPGRKGGLGIEKRTRPRVDAHLRLRRMCTNGSGR